MRLLNEVIKNINSVHGNNREVKEIKKWNNLKGFAKARGDCSRRETRMTGGGPNEAGEVEDEDILILRSDKKVTISVTERVSQMLSSTPAFTGISGSFDLFEPPTTLPPQTEISEACAVPAVFERQEVIATSRPEGSRTRKRGIEQPNHILSVCDLLPLQQEVLCKQMEVFSAQLQFIE